MRTFKIVVAYDGTDFHGWQMQPDAKTVTSCMQNTFRKVFGKTINLLGTSRTDSGVHAYCQVARFQSDINIAEKTILDAWNSSLPKSILIRELQQVDDSFNPLRNILQKTYYYHLFLKRPLPFVARFGWHYKFIDKLDIAKFNECLQLYVGEHDFGSFCKVEEDKSTIRKIDSIQLRKFSKFNVLQIEVRGKSFLRFQIRRMVGYALDVASRDNLTVGYLKEILDNPNQQQILLKAEGCGLCLRKVDLSTIALAKVDKNE